MDGYRELANAVVVQAVKDWRSASAAIRMNPDHEAAKKTLKDCERFFLSDWFGVLSGLNGKAILQKLKAEVRK